MRELVRIPFEGIPAFPGQEQGEIHLTRETVAHHDGDGGITFGEAWTVYPSTVVQARYGGSYEGGRWVCFPVGPGVLERPFWADWNGSDVECMVWWDCAADEGWPVGRGGDPSAAYTDMVARLLRLAGVAADEVGS